MAKNTDGTEAAPDFSSNPQPVGRTVRVNYASADVSEGTAFIHPESRTVIQDKPVSVPDDEWTGSMLASRFLTEK